MLISLNLVALVELLNSLPQLIVELLYLFHPLVILPTKLGVRGNGSEINSGAQVDAVNHLEWRDTHGLAWSPIECKLDMA